MAADNKDELLAVTNKEFSKLIALLNEISNKTAMKKREDNASLKDVIAHRTEGPLWS